MSDSQSLKNAASRAADLIANADALIIAAGAGMGMDSGLPDFRGSAGFWADVPSSKDLSVATGALGLMSIEAAFKDPQCRT